MKARHDRPICSSTGRSNSSTAAWLALRTMPSSSISQMASPAWSTIARLSASLRRSCEATSRMPATAARSTSPSSPGHVHGERRGVQIVPGHGGDDLADLPSHLEPALDGIGGGGDLVPPTHPERLDVDQAACEPSGRLGHLTQGPADRPGHQSTHERRGEPDHAEQQDRRVELGLGVGDRPVGLGHHPSGRLCLDRPQLVEVGGEALTCRHASGP
jgi:hypothetical protein